MLAVRTAVQYAASCRIVFTCRLNIAMLIASNVFINIMSTWKLIQRRCYDLLSYKYSLLVILVAFTCIFIGIVHFGEVRIILIFFVHAVI